MKLKHCPLRDEINSRNMKFIDIIYTELKESCWLICSYHFSYALIPLYTEFQPPSIKETKSFSLQCLHQNQNKTFPHNNVNFCLF